MKHIYLDSPKPFKVFAHRGFTYSNDKVVRDENTIEAFRAALDAGADYLELDVQASADGVAVVFHDEQLDRVSNSVGSISSRTWTELQQVELNFGGHIPSIAQVLTTFSKAKINIDIKNSAAIKDLANAITNQNAHDRVLLTSFSEKRRQVAVDSSPGVATSPSAWLILRIKLGQLIGLDLTRLLKNVNVLQIPVSYGFLRLDSPKFIESVKRRGVEVVYWTINDPAEAMRLKQIGADGIVTDRTDLIVSALHSS
ncbi:MAG: glycerophosphodiester phosphodiesterase family protein [Micrococcales bacterium]